MTEKPSKNPNQKRHQKVPMAPLTPEQQAELKAALAKAEAERKAEEQRIQLFNASVPTMSYRQLRSTLRDLSKRPEAGTAMWATALSVVLENTKTKENPFAKLSCYVR
jgi:hypothetical protein